MAKGAFLTTDIKHLLVDIYLENRSLGPTKTREELLKRMKEKGLDKNFGPDYPSVSSVSVQLKKCKENDDKQTPESKRLDNPWSTASMAEYPIPAEALPSILEVWVWARENLNDTFTIRQAQWAARFYTVTKDIKTLYYLSSVQARSERIYELTGEPFESSHFDLWIFSHMTGQLFSLERQKKIIGQSKVWLLLDEQEKKFNALRGLTLDEVEEKLLRDMEHKGGKNERLNKTTNT